MISYSELKKGVKIVLDGEPCEITESAPLFKARGHSVLKTKVRNLKTGSVFSRTFHPSDSFKEPDISKIEAKFLYSHRNKYVFCEKDNSSQRFDLTSQQIGDRSNFLKPNQIVEALIFEGETVNIFLPIKIHLKIIETPPSLKGERAQAGTKTATLETGAKINVPPFIESGDTIEINTETEEYVRRIE